MSKLDELEYADDSSEAWSSSDSDYVSEDEEPENLQELLANQDPPSSNDILQNSLNALEKHAHAQQVPGPSAPPAIVPPPAHQRPTRSGRVPHPPVLNDREAELFASLFNFDDDRDDEEDDPTFEPPPERPRHRDIETLMPARAGNDLASLLDQSNQAFIAEQARQNTYGSDSESSSQPRKRGRRAIFTKEEAMRRRMERNKRIAADRRQNKKERDRQDALRLSELAEENGQLRREVAALREKESAFLTQARAFDAQRIQWEAERHDLYMRLHEFSRRTFGR